MNRDHQAIVERIKDLDYFVQWAGYPWTFLAHYAITEFLGASGIRGKKVLDIGACTGRMSTLFAILGARVTGVDVDGRRLAAARMEARKFGVEDQVEFIEYDGRLDIFSPETFDVVFTKSVLVLIPELS